MRAASNRREAGMAVALARGMAWRPTHILVGMDFSQPALAALRVAAQLARRSGARLSLLHVLPAARELTTGFEALDHLLIRKADFAAEESEMRALLTALAETLTPVQVEVDVARGSAAVEILVRRQLRGVDLVAIGAGGHPVREFFLGSVADRVLRRPGCPLLLVRSAPPSGELKRIAVGQERCKTTTPWLESALALAHVSRAELTAIHVLPLQGYLSNGHEVDLHPERAREALADLVARLDRTVPCAVHAERGDAAYVLGEQLRSKELDLLVVGAERNRDGWPGRVTDRLARTPGANLLVIWPPDESDESFEAA